MIRRLVGLGVCSVLGSLLLWASPVSAAPMTGAGAAAARVPAVTIAAAVRNVATGYYHDCFGYTGYFRSGSYVMGADWDRNGTVDECFGIAEDRTIWHAWPGSGSWQEMPHNGRADDTDSYFISQGRRTVRVFVSPNQLYCSSLGSSWMTWVRC
jgi:hypothetical protein